MPCSAAALLVWRAPEASPRTLRSTLQDSYGLTAAEALLAQALAEGMTLKRFAQQRALGYETVRTYLRRIMAKTDTHRQAELIRLAMAHQVAGHVTVITAMGRNPAALMRLNPLPPPA